MEEGEALERRFFSPIDDVFGRAANAIR